MGREHLLRATCLLILLISHASAQNVSEEKPSASLGEQMDLEQMSWLVGRWVGEGFGGICEEVWGPALAGAMFGMFRLVIDDKVKFYELQTISSDSTGTALRVKHFDANLVGWEEKDDCPLAPLTALEPNKIEFDGITYQLISPDSLKISVTMKSADGTTRQVVIDCRRGK